MKNLLEVKTKKNGAFIFIDEPNIIGKEKIASKNCCADKFIKYIRESQSLETLNKNDFKYTNGINIFKHCPHTI